MEPSRTDGEIGARRSRRFQGAPSSDIAPGTGTPRIESAARGPYGARLKRLRACGGFLTRRSWASALDVLLPVDGPNSTKGGIMVVKRWWTAAAAAVSTFALSALAFAQQQGADLDVNVTTPGSSPQWYTQWYIWAGVGVFLLLVIALTNRGGSRT